MSSKTITCGKFDNNVVFDLSRKKTKSNLFVNTKPLKRIEYDVLGTDGKNIIFRNIEYDMTLFFYDQYKTLNFLVATRKEYELLADYICVFDLRVTVLELSFPFFNNIRFYNNARINFQQTSEKLNKLKSFNIKGGNVSASLNRSFRKKAFTKHKVKDSYDALFAMANTGAYREVFKFKEERKSRVIIALDVNSMYLQAMQGRFMSPGSFRSINLNKIGNIDDLPQGLFNVILKGANNEFIRKFHPFSHHVFMEKFPFLLFPDEEIKTVLNRDEIEYYKNHFDEVSIVDGIVTEKLVTHPLLNKGLKIFNQKGKARTEDAKLLNKIKLVHLHSALSPTRKSKYTFDNKIDLDKFLQTAYGIAAEQMSVKELFLIIRRHKSHMQLKIENNKFVLLANNYSSSETVQSFSAEIISRAKIHILEKMEKLLSIRSIEICYVNVDSIHISLDKSELESFWCKMSNDIGDALGQFKVEAIADKGYWFDLGRYYLFNGGQLIKYKNSNFNPVGNKHPFLTKRSQLRLLKTSGMVFKRLQTLRVEDNFSCRKILNGTFGKNICFSRYPMSLLRDHSKDSQTLREVVKSKKIKFRNYINLKTLEKTSSSS